MSVEIRLPQLADEMLVAKVGAWLKREGDPVRAGEPIVEIETDKTNVEVEAPASGYLQRIIVPAGSDDVAVNTVLAVIANEVVAVAPAPSPITDISAFASESGSTANGEAGSNLGLELERTLNRELELGRARNQERPSPLPPAPSTLSPEPQPTSITPLAREIARLSGLDLSTVRPATGGRITRRDVERALGHDGPSATVLHVPLATVAQPASPAQPAPPESAAPELPIEPSGPQEPPEPATPETPLAPPEPAAPQSAPEPAAPQTLPEAPEPAQQHVPSEAAGSTLPAPPDTPGEVALFDVQPLNNVRRVTATRLQQAKQTVPHFYLDVECQVDGLIELRAKWNARHAEAKLTVTDFVVFAASRALIQVPLANAAWAETAVRVYRSVDMAVAVNTSKGLLTPVVRGCQQKSLVAISREIAALAERARAGQLRPDEYTGATFTVSNLGMFGVTGITPIVNPPAACVLGVGAIEQRPVVSDGQVVPGHTMRCTLSADHRTIDGATGAQLMAALRRRLEDPLALMLEG